MCAAKPCERSGRVSSRWGKVTVLVEHVKISTGIVSDGHQLAVCGQTRFAISQKLQVASSCEGYHVGQRT